MQLVKSFDGAANAVMLSNPKGTMQGCRLMTRAEYRKQFNLKRSEAEKQHNEYLRINGVIANKNIAARIAGGELLITGIKEYDKTGKGTINFIEASRVGVPKPNLEVLSDDELLAEIERRKAKQN